MKLRAFHQAAAAAILLLACTLSAACQVVEEDGSALAPAVRGAYEVDPVFREFYLLLGGQNSLGLAISPMVESGSLQIQYMENALLRFQPGEEPGRQYSLAPIGLELGFQDQPLPLLEQTGARVIDGYLLYEEFAPLYDVLQGSRFVGRPLTQVRLNSEIPRIEQYFENAGFYRSLDEPVGQVHLLSYGAHKCGLACRPALAAAAQVVPLTGPPQIFLGGIARTGSDLFGAPLSAPYLASDGLIEQVYTSAVIASAPQEIASFHLRPAAKLSGYPASPPAGRINDPRMLFFPVEGELGYNIPAVFSEFIDRHGGMDMAGLPTSELFPEGSLFRQCFENYCLDYDPGAGGNAGIRPAPVGEHYLLAHQPPPEAAPQAPAAAAALELSGEEPRPSISVTLAHPLLAPGKAQEFTLLIVDEGTQTPLPNQPAGLSLVLPDGQTPSYTFPPSAADGRSSLTLPVFPGRPGQLFLYEVCLQGSPAGECTSGSYLMWDF